MPVIDHREFETLELEATRLASGYPLHDVFAIDLEGHRECTIPALLGRLREIGPTELPWVVRSLFAVRRVLGRVAGWDRPDAGSTAVGAESDVPADLAGASLVPPGSPAGPFRTLYLRPEQAVYATRNGTVDARLVVALRPSRTGYRLYWASYVRPVGRITRFYMTSIDPFRRLLVYPGLERWLTRSWRADEGSRWSG